MRIARLWEFIITRTILNNGKTRDTANDNHASSISDKSKNNNTSSGEDVRNDNPALGIQDSIDGYYSDSTPSNATEQIKSNALVLVDSDPDVSLANISSKFNPDIHLDFLISKRIHRAIKRKQTALQLHQDDTMPQLWMYFDSGASRSVISPTSPIRKHLT